MEENKKGINQNFQKLFNKALKFIGIRPRSKQEILTYLKKKSPRNQKLINEIFKELKVLGLVNDKDFVNWWIEQRITFRPKGKKALILELKQKGIERELIENALQEKLDEAVLAKKLVEKKWKIFKKLSEWEQKQKLSAFLGRRGFSWETIKKVLDETLKKK